MDPSPLHVLIVDDSPEDRLAVRRLLARVAPDAYTLAEADRGAQALAAVRLAPPDCVLLDYRLPDQDGLAVLAALRAVGDVPVVLFTGVGNEALAAAALQQGAQGYLVKQTLTPELLHMTIQRAVAAVRLARERDQSLALLSTVLDALPVGVGVIGPGMGVTQLNPALTAWLGRPAEDLLGQPLPALAAALAPPCAQVLRGEPFDDLELSFPAADAPDERWLSFSGTPVRGAGAASALGVITARDITASKRAEAGLQGVAARLQVLAEASAAFAAAGPGAEAILDQVARLSAKALSAECSLWLSEGDAPWLRIAAFANAGPEDGSVGAAGFADTREPGDSSTLWAQVVRSGQALLVPPLNRATSRELGAPAQDQRATAAQPSPRSTIIAPMRIPGQILGCLSLTRYGDTSPAFAPDDLSLAQDLADRAALALHNARLHQELQAAQQGAAETHAVLEAIIASIPNGIGYLDRDLCYRLVNPALARINGRTPAEHLGRTMAELLPDLAPRFEPVARQVLATGEAARDIELYGKPCTQNGVTHAWLMSYFPVPGPTGDIAGVGVTVTNLTESKRTEAALQASQQNLSTLIENTDGKIWSVDERYRLIIGNSHFLHGVGAVIGRELVPGDCLVSLPLPQAALDEWRAYYDLALAGEVFSLEAANHFGPEPSIFEYRFSPIRSAAGAITGATIFGRDITAQRQTEQALQREHRQLEAIVAALDEGVIALRLDGSIVVMNPSARRLVLGDLSVEPYTAPEIIERSPMVLIEPDGRVVEREDWPLMRVLRGEEFSNWELRLRAPGSPEERWVTISGRIIDEAGGGQALGIVTRIDITQRKRDAAALEAHAENLSRTNAELTRALTLKDEFLAMMSHELRTPLTAVLGVAEALDAELYGPLSDRQRQALATISASGNHLLAILSDILDLAHIEAGQATLDVQPVDVEHLCRSTTQLVQASAQKKGVHLLRTVAVGVEGLRADERRLTQILVNLLDNAVKFTPRGGTVGLEVTADASREQITFVVWDTGIGIAQAEYHRLFQPFTQVDGRLARAYGGIGLGLTLVRRLVELHGGSVSLESTQGQGSRFTVSLPWPPGENLGPAAARRPALSPRIWARPPRVVLADDHEITLQLYADLLRQQGCQVMLARTGAEALAQVRSARPDVAVLDIQMPALDGLSLIRKIREDEALAAIPIIALTALVMPGDREQCLAAGANVYLAKPISLRTLAATIAALLAYPDHPSAAGR